MPKIQSSLTSSSDIDRPECAACGTRMWLRRVSPAVKGTEWRTFECPVCDITAASNNAQRDHGTPTPV